MGHSMPLQRMERGVWINTYLRDKGNVGAFMMRIGLVGMLSWYIFIWNPNPTNPKASLFEVRSGLEDPPEGTERKSCPESFIVH